MCLQVPSVLVRKSGQSQMLSPTSKPRMRDAVLAAGGRVGDLVVAEDAVAAEVLDAELPPRRRAGGGCRSVLRGAWQAFDRRRAARRKPRRCERSCPRRHLHGAYAAPLAGSNRTTKSGATIAPATSRRNRPRGGTSAGTPSSPAPPRRRPTQSPVFHAGRNTTSTLRFIVNSYAHLTHSSQRQDEQRHGQRVVPRRFEEPAALAHGHAARHAARRARQADGPAQQTALRPRMGDRVPDRQHARSRPGRSRAVADGRPGATGGGWAGRGGEGSWGREPDLIESVLVEHGQERHPRPQAGDDEDRGGRQGRPIPARRPSCGRP